MVDRLAVVAVLALVLTLPLWLIPPLVLVLPPLIWGWLTYRVMSFDALVDHASAEERRTILRQHRWPLLLIGVICGYLGAAPGIVWASMALFAVLFVLLVPLAIWIYTFVFVFSSLWFAHYALDALQRLRDQRPPNAGGGAGGAGTRPRDRPAVARSRGSADPMPEFGLSSSATKSSPASAPTSICPSSSSCWPNAACAWPGPNTWATSRRASPPRCGVPWPRATWWCAPGASAPHRTTIPASEPPPPWACRWRCTPKPGA